jgi:hypothetical protein
MRRVFRITMILILMVSAAGILSAQDRIQIELLGAIRTPRKTEIFQRSAAGNRIPVPVAVR